MKKYILKTIAFLGILLLLLFGFESVTAQLILFNTDFKLKNNAEYLVLGHSHPEQAFNDSLISNLVNLAESGKSYFYTYYKSKEFIKNNPSLKTVFIEFTNNSIDPKMDIWTWDCNYMEYRVEKFSPLIDKKGALKLLLKNPKCVVNSMPFILNERFNQCVNNNLIFSKNIGGYKVADANNKSEIMNRDVRMKELDEYDKYSSSFSSINISYLQKLINFSQQQGKNVVLIRTPQRNDYEYWDNELLFQKIRQKYFGHIAFLDLTQFKLEDHEYLDPAHLNYEGATRFSKWFDKMLKTQPEILLEGKIVKYNE